MGAGSGGGERARAQGDAGECVQLADFGGGCRSRGGGGGWSLTGDTREEVIARGGGWSGRISIGE